MYVMDNSLTQEDYLHLSKFAYNNGHQSSLGMSPYRDMYGREYHPLISQDEPIDRVMLGLDMVKEMEQKVIRIMKKLKIAQDREYINNSKLVSTCISRRS